MATAMATSNAFAEIMPPSAFASSSTPTKSMRYDVFINHRGPDTKQTLASSIYSALKPLGIEVFLDEPELELGDSIPSELQYAIATSFLHIAILSPRYAESTWCLQELSLMLQTGKKIIPVFYDVDITDIRYIKGSYAKAFCKHQAQARYTSQKLEEWKMALQTVSFFKGHTVNNDDDHRMLKENIISYVLEHPKRHSFVVAEYPVGLDEISQDFERSVIESSKDVKIVGITGMGGCGKTTLAKHYYNKKKQSFFRCSFVCDVRDTPNKNLCRKQEKMFRDIAGWENISFTSVEEGKAILAEYLRSIQVFIIVDDVDHLNQLNSLLPIKDNNINQNSIIVITSRDSSILTSWGIPSDCIYKMKGLNAEHGMELFCWHAFGQLSPINEFEHLVQKFLKVCQGLPLSLKVLGRLVRGESKEFWDDQLNQVSRLLPEDIKSVLKVSFDALDKEAKEVFLDISCFFTGTETETDSAITLWDGSGWSGLCSLKKLVNKCLVEVDESKYIRMHDQLRDLGRQIAETWTPYRLWSQKQIDHIEEQGEKIVLIRGIKAETDEFYEDAMKLVRGSNISKRRLEILDVENNYFTEELALIAEPLIWLRWGNFPHTAVPVWISMKKLRVLELRKASKLEQLWSETADPPVQLRLLKIMHADSFLRFPRSIRFLKHLKKISFNSDAPIEGLPEEFCLLQSLECLKLVGCRKLNSLPSKFGDLKNLRCLSLEGCSGIEGLPEAFGRLQLLKELNLTGCHKLKSLPCEFSNLTNLQYLELRGCSGIEGLPEEFCRLQLLVRLNLCDSHNLKSLPNKFGNLTNLRDLFLSGVEVLPEEFGGLRSLSYFDLSVCHNLKSLPSMFGDLTNLHTLNLRGCSGIEGLPEDFCRLQSLGSLFLIGCHNLKSLPSKFGNLTNLRHLELKNCTRIEILPEEFGCLRSLGNLDLSGCHNLKSLPRKFCDLTNLVSLYLSECNGLMIPMETFAQLASLGILTFSGCSEHTELVIQPGCFPSFCSLRSMGVAYYPVSRISISPQCCPRLENLDISDNDDIVEIDSLPTSVKYISLARCSKLESISLNCGLVENMRIRECGKLRKIQGLENCRRLEMLNAQACSLRSLEGVKSVSLTAACDIALEAFLQILSREKWPMESTLCWRTASGVEASIKSFAFPGLTMVDLVEREEKSGYLSRYSFGKERSPKEAAMLCRVIDAASDTIALLRLSSGVTARVCVLMKGNGYTYVFPHDLSLCEAKFVLICIQPNGEFL